MLKNCCISAKVAPTRQMSHTAHPTGGHNGAVTVSVSQPYSEVRHTVPTISKNIHTLSSHPGSQTSTGNTMIVSQRVGTQPAGTLQTIPGVTVAQSPVVQQGVASGSILSVTPQQSNVPVSATDGKERYVPYVIFRFMSQYYGTLMRVLSRIFCKFCSKCFRIC